MKPALLVLLALPLLGSAIYRGPLAPASYFRDPILQGPEAAACKTGAPEATLAGIRWAEGSHRPAPPHALPTVQGAYGLDERWHMERAARYGAFDPLDPYDAAYITARLYLDHLTALGDEDLAVTAHLYGVSGAKAHGVAGEYLARVRSRR